MMFHHKGSKGLITYLGGEMSIQMKYFVLKPRSKTPTDPHAFASREAMRAYADEIEETDPQLAYSLRVWAAEESHREKKLREQALERLTCNGGEIN